MTNRYRAVTLVFALTLLLAANVAAQRPGSATMVSGVWRGWVLQPDEDSLWVTFLVEQKGKNLTFNWAMGQGSVLLCRLSRRGSPGFDGQCQDGRLDSQGGRNRIFMNMAPPSAGGRGDSLRTRPAR
jgi:hypothetical protein